MTVATRYNLYKAGKITKEQFLYEVRKDQSVPFITPLTSFDDAVTMLKHRRIVVENFEAPIQEEASPYDQGMAANKSGKNYTDNPYSKEYDEEEYNDWTDGWMDSESAGQADHDDAQLDKEGGEVIPDGLSGSDEEMIGDYEEDMANSEMGKHMSDMYKEGEGGGKFAILNSKGGRQVDKTFDSKEAASDYMRNNPSMHGKSAGLKIVQLSSNPKVHSMNEAPSLREQVQDFVKKAMEGGSSMDEAKEQAREYFETEKAALNEAAKPKLGIDQVNPYELKKGIECEMGYNDKPAPGWGEVDAKTIESEYKKALGKALKNLNKDPMYYTRLQANGGKKEKKVTEKKVQSDGYLKAKAPKAVNEGIKTSVSKIREYVVAQLKGEGITAKTNDAAHNQDVLNQINKVPNPTAKKELGDAFKAGKTIDL